MDTPLWKAVTAEIIGTFTLVFIGAGSIMADQLTGGKIGLVGIALAHGLAIGTMVLAVGAVSGGHFNPAVTLGFLVAGRQTLKRGLNYIGAQVIGAVLAASFLTVVFPEATRRAVHLGTPELASGIPAGIGIFVEAILTFLLVTVIFGTAVDPRGPRVIAGLAIGLAITMDILAGGALTGAAMNPARAFGPALYANFWENQSVYWIGPFVGAIVAAVMYRSMMDSANPNGR